MRVTFITDLGIELQYELNNTKTARRWLDVLSRCSPAMLLRNDYSFKHGWATSTELMGLRQQLYNKASALGLSPTTRLLQHELNRLHKSFANLAPDPNGDNIRSGTTKLLVDLNLLVHAIEFETANLQHHREQYQLKLDFNHHRGHYAQDSHPIDTAELSHFSPNMDFGSLHIHYTYVGRHFLEMFDAQDFESPPEHFKPQRHFNASCAMVFSEPQDNTSRRLAMLRFYQDHNPAYWRIPFDDPSMCIGFFQLGRLVNHSYTTHSQRASLRTHLASAKITGWKCYTNTKSS